MATNSHNEKRKTWINQGLKMVIILTAATAVLFGVFLWLDLPARERFAVVNQEIEKVRRNAMEPIGAVERVAGEYVPFLRGDGFINSLGCLPDVHCPVIHRTWFTPIDPGREWSFAETALKAEGYTPAVGDESACNQMAAGSTCSVTGEKENLTLRMDVKATDSVTPPSKNVAPKQWRLVTVVAEYYWDR